MDHIPLAERLRPKSLDEFIGQRHLLDPGKPLNAAFSSNRPHSMILWGPPGTGKTTLARLMASAFDAQFLTVSAVLSGVKDIRDAVAQAKEVRDLSDRSTILFVDEVHRFNKSQQDAFLPHVESGLLTFIGATTENPSFEVNNALLSRAAVYQLKPLTEDDLKSLVSRALSVREPALALDDGVVGLLVAYADGDARRLLNHLEILMDAADAAGAQVISETMFKELSAASVRRGDKGGDTFYDLISALHKSVRGSNPDAALYWFTRMLDAGADPSYLARRIVRMAWEDIGLADPRAAEIAQNAAAAYERLGTPEGELALAQAVLYLSVAAKSNAGYTAYNAARAFVANDGSREVPVHLRNAPTKLMKELGYGKAYRYAHDEPNAYAAGETYFPENMKQPSFYKPKPYGLEKKIAEKIDFLKSLDDEAKKNKR